MSLVIRTAQGHNTVQSFRKPKNQADDVFMARVQKFKALHYPTSYFEIAEVEKAVKLGGKNGRERFMLKVLFPGTDQPIIVEKMYNTRERAQEKAEILYGSIEGCDYEVLSTKEL